MEESYFQFRQPELEECYFKVNKDFFKITEKSKDKPKRIKLPVKTKIMRNNIIDNKSFVTLLIEVGGKNDDVPFYARVQISSLFILGKDLHNDERESLLNINAPALLLSYARPVIASLTSDAGLPRYNIPFMNFTK